MKSNTSQINFIRHGHLVGFALILALLPFTSLEASPFIENGAQCWLAEEYVAKGGIDQAGVVQVREIQKIIQKVGSIPNITPPLAICDTQEQLGNGAYVTNRREPLRLTTGMLKILGADEDMMAAIIGHEISHLSLRHIELRQSKNPIFQSDANSVAQATINQYGDIDMAKYNFAVVYLGERNAFIRNQEAEADDRGIEFASKAGFNPEGARKLFSIVFEKGGKGYSTFFDDHPGLIERFIESGVRTQDESFDQVASKLASQQKWGELNATIKRWLNALPYSPNAWYYAAKLHNGVKSKELEDLENTFTYLQPALSKRQIEIDQAMLTMCVDLYSQGYALESANCSRGLSDSGREQFNKQTFRGILILGPNSPAPIRFALITDKDKGNLITNGDWPNLVNSAEIPAWKPIRFKPQ